MLETFHQLREPAFGVNPDPRFLYLSRTHREAFSSLLYRIEMDSGFLAMVAQPGMGKTTLLFHLLEQLQPKAKTAFIFQTQCTSSELLRHLLSEFECRTDITDPVVVLQELKSMLVAQASAGRRCVVIIDEAQNLGQDVLETIRLLSNFETPRRKLLSIVLSGQSELGEMLARPELRQLRQRLSCIVHLERFSTQETAHYIAHRLAVAGYSGHLSELISADALARIADLSEGVPRVINNLCFNALSLSYALGVKPIDIDVVAEVGADLGLAGGRTVAPDEPMVDVWKDEWKDEWKNITIGSEGTAACSLDPASADPVAETAEAPAKVDIERQWCEPYQPEEPCRAAVAVAEDKGDASSISGAESCVRRRTGEATLVRGLVCLLVLLLTPAIDRPSNRNVSAQSIGSTPVAKPASGVVLPRTDDAESNRQERRARVPAVSSRSYLNGGKYDSRKLSRLQRRSRAPVDLSLASFVPEPLLNPLPLTPMPLSARTAFSPPRSKVSARASGSHQWLHGVRSVSRYVPPKPVWQPIPRYPDLARSGNQEQDIQLLLSISSSGEVSDVGILRGGGALAYAAKRTAKTWKYLPARSNGRPIGSKALVTIHFQQH